jgi:hypothetical protein
MPRQKINSAQQDDHWAALVGWSVESPYVQLGVEEVAGFSIVDVLYGQDRDNLVKLGHALSEAFSLPIEVPADLGADDSLTESARSIEFKERIMAERGRAVLDVVTGSWAAASPSGSYTGLWVNLDRRGCNSLIQTLRRARDKAFGRDE